jgi:hypothetical protein
MCPNESVSVRTEWTRSLLAKVLFCPQARFSDLKEMGSFDSTFTVEGEYVRAATIGSFDFGELFDFLGEVRREVIKAGLDKVLIDSRSTAGTMTEAERFQGGQKIAELFGAKIKVALMMQPEVITKLGELTANNRGARFYVAATEEEALGWLLA